MAWSQMNPSAGSSDTERSSPCSYVWNQLSDIEGLEGNSRILRHDPMTSLRVPFLPPAKCPRSIPPIVGVRPTPPGSKARAILWRMGSRGPGSTQGLSPTRARSFETLAIIGTGRYVSPSTYPCFTSPPVHATSSFPSASISSPSRSSLTPSIILCTGGGASGEARGEGRGAEVGIARKGRGTAHAAPGHETPQRCSLFLP